MRKYADHCVKMLLRQDNPPRPGRAGTFIFGQEFKDQEDYFKQTPVLVEIMPFTGNYMMMNGFPEGFEKKVYTMKDGHQGGPFPKYNMNADKLMFFSGTDPENMNDLGAHVEFHLGEGEDEEAFEFDQPRCIFIPKGVRHGPLYVTRFRRNFVIMDILTAPTRLAAGTDNDFDYVADESKLILS